MSVTVTPPTGTPPVVHPNAGMVEVSFDVLYLFSEPEVTVAVYAKDAWASAVVTP